MLITLSRHTWMPIYRFPHDCLRIANYKYILSFLLIGSSQMSDESAFCAMLKMPPNWPMYELSAFVFFLGPMLVIMVLYARMGITIRSRSLKFPGETKHLDSRTKPIIRMLGKVSSSRHYFTINLIIYYTVACFVIIQRKLSSFESP